MKKGWNIITLIFAIITIILLLITIILIFIKILGQSPTDVKILYSTIGFLIALQIVIITILFQIKENVGELKEFKRQTISEIKEIKTKLI
ncbi:hypothetical protein ES705_16919 [subsurface metagenome]